MVMVNLNMKFLYISILVFGFSIRVYTQSNDNFMNVEVLTPTSTKENAITKDYTKNDALFTGIDTVSCFCEDTLFNGKCYAVLYYKNGLLIKQNGFYETGEIMFQKFYKDAILDSTLTVWYQNNQIKTIINYSEKEKLFPTTTEWYKNGQIKTKIEYFGQTGIYKEWYENGQIKSDADINSPLGDIASYSKDWCPNGFQIQDLKINQGKKPYQRYNCDSVKIAEGTYIDFEFFWVGKKTEWYGNGIKAFESYFQDGNTRQEANIRTGTWKYYSEQGELIKEEVYKKNELIDTKEYLPLKMKKD